jgi:hypothetical protein
MTATRIANGNQTINSNARTISTRQSSKSFLLASTALPDHLHHTTRCMCGTTAIAESTQRAKKVFSKNDGLLRKIAVRH